MDPSFTTPKIAYLNKEALQKVNVLEEKLGGVYVIAYDQPLTPAQLTPEQLAEVQKMEAELGLCLVAYHKKE